MFSIEAQISARLHSQLAPIFKRIGSNIQLPNKHLVSNPEKLAIERPKKMAKQSLHNFDLQSKKSKEETFPAKDGCPRKQSLCTKKSKLRSMLSIDSIERSQAEGIFLKPPPQQSPKFTGSVTSFHKYVHNPLQPPLMPSMAVSKRTIGNASSRYSLT